jgi:hypothetical protein
MAQNPGGKERTKDEFMQLASGFGLVTSILLAISLAFVQSRVYRSFEA